MQASDDLLNKAAAIRDNASPTSLEQAQASDSLLDNMANGQKQRADLVLDVVTKVNPDKAAKANKLSRQFGLNPQTVQQNQDELERVARIREAQKLMHASPFLARQMTDPAFAAIAQDDLHSLGDFEKVIQVLKNTGSAGFSGLQRASAGVVGAVQAPLELAAPALDPLTGVDKNPLRSAAEGLSGYRKGIEAQAKANMPKAGGNIEAGFYSGIGSLATNLAALPLAFLPGGQAAALTAMTAPVGGGAYGEARDKGIAPLQAATYGASQAVIEYATEKLPLSKLIGDVKGGTSFVKTLGKQAALEVPGEQVATALQDLNEWAVLNPEKPFSEYLKERPDAAAQTLVATLVGVGGQVTVTKGIEKAMQRMGGQQEKAQQAEQNAEAFGQLDQLAAASKVRERDADTFEKFVAQATEDGPMQDVFISANTLAQSGVAEALAQVSPSVAEQFETALATGGDIRIPLAEYTSRIAGTEYSQPLLEHLKTEPNGFSQAEAKDFMKNQAAELQVEVERNLSEMQGNAEFKEGQERVKQRVLEDLNRIGRFTSAKNEVDATLIAARSAVRAAQLGMTPEQFFEKQGLRVQAESVVGGEVLDQAITHEIEVGGVMRPTQNSKGQPIHPTREGVENFWQWFDGSKVVDADGKPLVVYHGTAKDFNVFNVNAKPVSGDVGKIGVFLTNDPKYASAYAGDLKGNAKDGGSVMPVYVSLKNPKVESVDLMEDIEATWDREKVAKYKAKLLRMGHDGIVFKGNGIDEIVAFNPEQIKSATGNQGTFDPSNPNILNQTGQSNRGGFTPDNNTISLLKNADLSTFLHEAGHYFFESDITLAGELANKPDPTEGEQQILKDVNALLSWHGIQGDINAQLQQWYGMEFEEKRSYHERTAESFEAYLFEGNAPSLELQPYFQKFRAWLSNVYRSLKEFIKNNPEAGKLNDEVRAVFDRMLATTEQIQTAEQGRSMMPLFTNPEQGGMMPEEFAAYQALGVDATNDAIQELQTRGLRDMQWLQNARAREIKKLQKEVDVLRNEVRIDVRAEVMSQPIYRAWQFLTAKEGPSGKIQTMALAEVYGGAVGKEFDKYALLDWKALVDRRMTSGDGLHPDVIAEMFGFTSGDEFIRALVDAVPPKDAVESMTDARMLEQNGDLISEDAIEKAADKAIHNEARARFVATEANALAKATGQKRILATAAKEFASAMIARLKIRDILPGQYASAQARAAGAAEKASRAGDMKTAAAEKRNQLIQTYATKAAYDAQDEVIKGVRFLSKYERDGIRKVIDPDYVDQIEALLERFDFRKRSLKDIDNRKSFALWLESQREQGYEPDVPEELKNEAFRKSYRDMTLEELRGLIDTVKQIDHIGRLKNRLLTAADNRAFSEIKKELIDSITENAVGRIANTRTPTTNMGRLFQTIKSFGSSHIKAATWARILDGGKDGGPVWEYLIRSANDRGNTETTMRSEATVALSKILDPVFKLGKMGGAGIHFKTIGRSLNREARIAIALNTGNEGNLQRLLGGEGWTVEQIMPVLQSISSAEWRAVQAVWDHFESYRPQIGAKERRVYGKEPKWIDRAPFSIQTSDGAQINLSGGYYPIKYDSAASQRAEEFADAEGAQRQLQGAFTSATTKRSFTKTRSSSVSGRPLIYTLSGVYSGVNDIIHDLAWHEWLIDANRILKSNSIDTAIRTAYGPAVKNQFKTWVADIAEGESGAQNAAEVALSRLRQGISAAGLGFNVMSAAMQVTGFNQSIVRVGAKWIGKGIAQYIASPLESARKVVRMSDFMADRSRTQFRELNELRNKVQDENATMRNIKLGTYFMMMRMQKLVDVPTWLGAYEKAMAEGTNSEDRAIALSDQAVIDSQGSGMTKDLSAVERGGPALKLFTVFYSYMNTAYNLGAMKLMTEKKKGKLAADMLMLFTVPVVLGEVIKMALTPGGGDDEWELEGLAHKLAAEQLSYLMGLMVVVREFGQVAKIVTGAEGAGRSYGGPAGLRTIADTYTLATQASQGDFDDAFVRASISVIGDLTGLPSAQINRSIRGTQAYIEGDTDNPASIAFGYQR